MKKRLTFLSLVQIAFFAVCLPTSPVFAQFWLLGEPQYDPEIYIKPYTQGEDRNDIPALTDIWNLIKQNYHKYSSRENKRERNKNNSRTFPTCLDVASDLATDLVDICANPDLDGWAIHSATTNGPCHDVILLFSPPPPKGDGKIYMVDPYVNDHRIYEMRNQGGKYFPIARFKKYWSCKKTNTEYFEILWVNSPVPERTEPLPPLVHFQCPNVNLDPNGTNTGERSCEQESTTGGGTGPITPVASRNPNDKIGANGHESERYLSGQEPLRYSVFFENVETATAAAQEVVVTDQLDVVNMDLDTFSLGNISFGETILTPPPGLSIYTTEVDLRPDNNLIAKIVANLDKTTGLLEWRFQSIDPETGNPTDDPLAGFLPPNVNPPEGDGSVSFIVVPKSGLPTDTEIRNSASIVFDTNAPIVTPEWVNTIDNDKPDSAVSALAATQSSLSFDVDWSGTDAGAGIKDYTIYVSVNGGPFNTWRTDTTDTSGTFIGQSQITYSFYSVARDLTGNVEDTPAGADTSTTIPLIGDFNGDGCVSKADYNILMADIRSNGPKDQAHELNGDGVVNRADARTLVGLFTNPRGAPCN